MPKGLCDSFRVWTKTILVLAIETHFGRLEQTALTLVISSHPCEQLSVSLCPPKITLTAVGSVNYFTPLQSLSSGFLRSNLLGLNVVDGLSN